MIERIHLLMSSGQSGLVLTSHEPHMATDSLRDYEETRLLKNDPVSLLVWDPYSGVCDAQGVLPLKEYCDKLGFIPDEETAALLTMETSSSNFMMVLDIFTKRSMQESGPSELVLLIQNADRELANLHNSVLMRLQKIAIEGQSSRCRVILQTSPGFEVPVELSNLYEVVDHKLPSDQERAQFLIEALGLSEEVMSPELIESTRGLSLTKASQYVAESIARSANGVPDPKLVFKLKAEYLKRSASLTIWSPEFESEIRCKPVSENLSSARDVVLLQEKTSVVDSNIPEGHVSGLFRFNQEGRQFKTWSDPIARDEFERVYAPQRDFYRLDTVVGFDFLKSYFRRSLRADVPQRARPKHVMFIGLPGTGKTMLARCLCGEFGLPLSQMRSDGLYQKYLGESEKAMTKILDTAAMVGGVLFIDEIEKFLPQSGNQESGGVGGRLLGSILEWLNDQTTNLVLSASNNVKNLPAAVKRSERTDLKVFFGFPGQEAKQAAWQMYMDFHELEAQKTPPDEFWTPADIKSCCRQAEQQGVSLVEAAELMVPSYYEDQQSVDELLTWAEESGCIDAETGKPFKRALKQPVVRGRVKRKIERKVGVE